MIIVILNIAIICLFRVRAKLLAFNNRAEISAKWNIRERERENRSERERERFR